MKKLAQALGVLFFLLVAAPIGAGLVWLTATIWQAIP